MSEIKWKSEGEGFWVSKCGRFSIEPLFYGRNSPVAYWLKDSETKKKYQIDKVRECKEQAGKIVRGKEAEPVLTSVSDDMF